MGSQPQQPSTLFGASAPLFWGLGAGIGAALLLFTKPTGLQTLGMGALGAGLGGLLKHTGAIQNFLPQTPTFAYQNQLGSGSGSIGKQAIQRALQQAQNNQNLPAFGGAGSSRGWFQLPELMAPPPISLNNTGANVVPKNNTPLTRYVNDGSIMPPQIAYNLIQAGQYNLVKGAKISRWYLWGEVFRIGLSDSVNLGNVRGVPLSIYYNAVRHAGNIDQVCDQIHQKVPIASWLRIQTTSSSHQLALGTDFSGSATWLRNTVLPAVRHVQGLVGIGPSDDVAWVWRKTAPGVHFDGNPRGPRVHSGLHVDSWTDKHPLKPGYQLYFRDNGSISRQEDQQTHYEPMLGLPAPQAPSATPAIVSGVGNVLLGLLSGEQGAASIVDTATPGNI